MLSYVGGLSVLRGYRGLPYTLGDAPSRMLGFGLDPCFSVSVELYEGWVLVALGTYGGVRKINKTQLVVSGSILGKQVHKEHAVYSCIPSQKHMKTYSWSYLHGALLTSLSVWGEDIPLDMQQRLLRITNYEKALQLSKQGLNSC